LNKSNTSEFKTGGFHNIDDVKDGKQLYKSYTIGGGFGNNKYVDIFDINDTVNTNKPNINHPDYKVHDENINKVNPKTPTTKTPTNNVVNFKEYQNHPKTEVGTQPSGLDNMKNFTQNQINQTYAEQQILNENHPFVNYKGYSGVSNYTYPHNASLYRSQIVPIVQLKPQLSKPTVNTQIIKPISEPIKMVSPKVTSAIPQISQVRQRLASIDEDNFSHIKTKLLPEDFTVDKSVKKHDYKFPIQYKSREYFNIIENFKKMISVGLSNLQNNEIKTLHELEALLYYMSKIEK
jgi:hypothetical protein